MYKNATKCNETIGKWCKTKHGASKIIDTFETYQSANYPLGRIALNVCFGNRQNYRREKLDFEVMDWPSQYHAILGRPAFLRFMAVPHYTYLVLKMPGPRGIITVKGSFEVSDLCDKEFHKMAQNFGIIANHAEKRDYRGRQATRGTRRRTRGKETTSRNTRRRRRSENGDIINIEKSRIQRL
jgi:hypothetical protein